MEQKEKKWLKEFDNDCWDTKDGVMTVTYLMKGGNKVGKLTERVTKEMIKSYVKIRLTQQRTELLEEILNLECLKEEKDSVVYGVEVDSRNQLRKEIIEEIKKL